MKQYYSISQYPSKQGQYFYNSFFKLHNIDAVYTPIQADESNFDIIVKQLIENEAFGINISMPFKNKILKYLYYKDAEVLRFNLANTVCILNKQLYGYNTDIQGVISSVSRINLTDRIIILGNGAMGKTFYSYMKSKGYKKVEVVSKSLSNWDSRHNPCEIIINCTSLGTVNTKSPLDHVSNDTRLVIDLAIKPNDLTMQSLNIEYISGADFYRSQFIRQYFIHTGKNISEEDYDIVASQNDKKINT